MALFKSMAFNQGGVSPYVPYNIESLIKTFTN